MILTNNFNNINNILFWLSAVVVFTSFHWVDASTYIDCYAALPGGFNSVGTNEYQSSATCASSCEGYNYFALYNHNQCFCGNSMSKNLETSSSCNAYCFGYKYEMCGGENAYSVYSIGDSALVDSVSDSSSVVSQSSGAATGSSKTGTASTKSSKSMVAALNTDLQSTLKTSVTTSSTTTGSSTPTSSSLPVSSETSQTGYSTPTTSTPTTAATSSSTNTANAVASADNAATSATTPMTSVVFSTSYRTQDGSTIYVTNTIIQSATGSAASGSSNGDSANANSKHKKKVNVGAIVGGVVGGVCGALVVAAIILFGIRHYNMKREEDRMEKEYQEAIKPVEYTGTSSSHGSFSFDNNINSKPIITPNGTTNSNILPTSTPLPKSASTTHNNINAIGNNSNLLRVNDNPFDDSRRISNGSIIMDGPPQNHVLTVVNPDSDD